jgi:hypothetical protein
VIDDELRDLGPDGLTPDRHQALREQLMATIAESPDGDAALLDEPPAAATVRARPSWRPMAAAAAAVIVVAAIAAGLFAGGSDTDLATTGGATTGGTITVPAPLDARPVLAAERVPCIMSTPERSRQVDLTDTSLAVPLAATTIIDACKAEVAELLSAGTPVPPVLCRDPGSALPTAIVVHVGGTCATKDYEPMADADLATLNQVRDLEASLWTIPGDCPSRTDLLSWVDDRVSEADLPVTVTDPAPGAPGDGCWVPSVDWTDGTVTVARQAGS